MKVGGRVSDLDVSLAPFLTALDARRGERGLRSTCVACSILESVRACSRWQTARFAGSRPVAALQRQSGAGRCAAMDGAGA